MYVPTTHRIRMKMINNTKWKAIILFIFDNSQLYQSLAKAFRPVKMFREGSEKLGLKPDLSLATSKVE